MFIVQHPHQPHQSPLFGMPRPRSATKHLFVSLHSPKEQDSEDDEEAKQDQRPSSQREEEQKPQHRSRKHFQRVSAHIDETENDITIAMDVHGFGVDDLKISLEDHVLSLSGKRRNRLKDTFFIQKRFVLAESIYDEATIEADLSEGVLEIKIEKKPELQPRTIPITMKQDTQRQNDTGIDPTNEKQTSPTSSTTVPGAKDIFVESVNEDELEEEIPDTNELENQSTDEKSQEDSVKDEDSAAWEEVAQSNT